MLKNYSIGGEFSTNKFFFNNEILNKFKSGSWTLSGRGALELIFKNKTNLLDKTIYLPAYNCPSIYKTVKKYFKKIIFYDLTINYLPKVKKFKKNSVLILVNYFGRQSNLNFDKNLIIIEDLSHSILNKLKFKKRRIYFLSLRKFGIFNLGGWTNIKHNKIYNPNSNFFEVFLKKKFKYQKKKKKNLAVEKKLIRLFKSEEKKIFIEKNYCIKKNQIKSLTNISEKKATKIRKINHFFLRKNIIKKYMKISYKKNEIPLYFLIKFSNMQKRNTVRSYMRKNNIYCPVFWDSSHLDLKNFPNSKRFFENILAIPIDHRFNNKDMEYIVKILNKYDF